MIKELEKILIHVSEHILKDKVFTPTYKDKDIVTNKDIEAERYIIQAIKKIHPTHAFISEEENQKNLTPEPTWIIDPIDGTLNYTRNIPQYGIQLSLYENKEAVLCAMYFPETKVFLHAVKNEGFYINHKRTHTQPLSLSKSILTFGDFSKSQPTSRNTQLKLMGRIMNHVMKVRIYGASSSDFAYVAMGITQGHIIFTNRLWELAAGLLMITEAGLSIKTLEYDNCKGILVGHKQILDDLEIYLS